MTAAGARHLARVPQMPSEEGLPGWYSSLVPRGIWVGWEAGSTRALVEKTQRESQPAHPAIYSQVPE